jgi:hypothetical protein
MGDEYENLLSSVLRWKPTERATPVEVSSLAPRFVAGDRSPLPSLRIKALPHTLQILTHPFFDEIRAESELPPAQRSMQFPHGLFSFTGDGLRLRFGMPCGAGECFPTRVCRKADWELKTMRDHIPSIVGKSYEPEVK